MATTSDTDSSSDIADDLSRDLDRLSLEQALRDFEIANARVIDLTQRLVEQTNEANRLRHEVESLRVAHAATNTQLQDVFASRTFRLAQMIQRAGRLAGRLR